MRHRWRYVGKGDTGAVAVSGVGVRTINGTVVPSASQCGSAEQHRSPAVKVMLEGKCRQQPRIVSEFRCLYRTLACLPSFASQVSKSAEADSP